MQPIEDSSDPSSTTDEFSETKQLNIEEEEKPEVEPQLTAEEEEELEAKEKKAKVTTYILIVFIDILIPLMLILSAISCMSLVGILFVLLLYIHVFICNRVKDSFKNSRICLIVDFVINFVVFIFAIFGYDHKSNAEWMKILGFDFDNIIADKPDFTTATSLIAMICQIVSLILIGKTKTEQFCEYRVKIFSSLGVQFGFDFVWAFCNAFNAATNCCYLYLPILLFFVISNITQSMVGVNLLPPVITRVIMVYSLLFAIFELYMVSYIGDKWNPASALHYNYIAEDNTKGVNVVVAVVFAYLSIQNLTAPGLCGGKPKPVPQALKSLSDFVLIIAFMCTFVFAMFYPNYLSILWMLIPAISSFVKFPTLRKLLFPLLTIVFTITFVAQAITTFYLFNPPRDDGTENTIEFIRLFGLYRYPNDFYFTACGFYIIMLLGQIGKITHVSASKQKKKEPKEEEKKPVIEFEEEEEPTEEQLKEMEIQRKKEEARKRREMHIKKIKKVMKQIGHVIYKSFSIIAVAAIIIIGITIGFYNNRFAFVILCCIFMIIVLLALYKKPVFEFIKIVSAIMAMIAAFYKTTINEDCLDPEQCLIYLKFDSIDNMISTGLVAPRDMSLAEFIWPIAVIFALSTFLTADSKALNFQLPPFITGAIFIFVAILHFIYVFVYDTNIFSLLFLIVGIMMITAQYLQKKPVLYFSCCLSCVAVSFQLVLLLLTHFNNARNLICSIIDESIVNLTHIYGPDVEVALLAAILFFSTIAFNTRGGGKMNYFVDSVLYEIRVILDLFYFYLCWIFIFLFSIVNDNASVIKFLLMLFFAFGRFTVNIFWKIRIPFLIFNVVYLCAQFIMHIFGFDNESESYYEWLRFIGFYFAGPGKPTNGQRNLTVLWQLITFFFGVVNARPYQRRVSDPKFDALLSTRIYNAICAMLHHWLPIIIQISLCASTLLNPSLFGWFSFVVMVLVNYNEKAMQNGDTLITIIFNICFIIQYLLFLGWQFHWFRDKFDRAIDTVPDPAKLREWLSWVGVYGVKIKQLTSNCVSAYFFTFYTTWHNTFVDYNMRYNDLPHILKELINWYTTYVYEIMLALIIIVSSCARSIDGCLFFILASILFLTSLLMNYPKFKALNILSIATFCIIALRLLSRLPVFTADDIGIWIKRAFDLPFERESNYEMLWIVIYALERLTIHIMKSDIYIDCNEKHVKHLAFRFLRCRQIARLEKLDQDILHQKHILDIEQINSIAEQPIKLAQTKGLGSQTEKAMMTTSEKLIDDPESMETHEDNQEEDEEKEKHKRKKRTWYSFIPNLMHTAAVNLTKLLAGSLHLNSEAGMNFLTLDTLQTLMIKMLRTYEMQRSYVPDEAELQFILDLPPSFALHFQSLADVIDFRLVDETKTKKYLITYIFKFLRRISLSLLTFMILIYMYIKPYFFSMIVIVLFCCLILPLDIKGYPTIYIAYLALVMFLFVLRNICTLDILEPYILDWSHSVEIEQMPISVIKMFGIDPEETSLVEIFLFLFSVFFVVDQLQWCEIYPPNYYYQRFRNQLPGFPMEYCYGIMNDPAKTYKLTKSRPKPFIKQFVQTMSKAGLIETIHSTVMLILDVVSFLLLLILWGMWTHGTDSQSPKDSGMTYVFKIDVAYVFILLIQTVFSLACYAFSLSSNHIALYITNVIWFLYTYCICNFYLYSQTRNIDSSLQFYIFVRFCWHLIAEHKCFRGRRIVAFKYPNFERDWRSMLYFNEFIRICPFVFEIQTILIWMSQKTKVPLLQFFVIRDAQLQLEDVICRQTNPKYVKPQKDQKNYLKGGLLLLLFAVILFVPLFFMAESSPDQLNNPPLTAQLEIGVSSFPTMFLANGRISSVGTNVQKQISDTRIDDLEFLVQVKAKTISAISFPSFSFDQFAPNADVVSLMKDKLGSTADLQPYFRMSFYFNIPTTISQTQEVVYQSNLPILDDANRKTLSEILSGNTTGTLGPFSLPLIVAIPRSEQATAVSDLYRNVCVHLASSTGATSTWELVLPDNGNSRFPYLQSDTNCQILLYSQETSADSGSVLSTDPSTIGLYLLLIITLGLIIRAFAFWLFNNLWINKMERPLEIYRLCIAVNAFRAARDIDKEKEMANKLLDTLSHREECIKMTSDPKAGNKH